MLSVEEVETPNIRGATSFGPPIADQRRQKTAVIIGAGIAGLASAILLARSNYQVFIFEKRDQEQFRNPLSGRSINFTLSSRGAAVLEALGTLDAALSKSVTLYGRGLHLRSGKYLTQPYGSRESHVLHAIQRRDLLEVLSNAATSLNQVSLSCGYTLASIDLEHRRATLTSRGDDVTVTQDFDLLIGADGVHSHTREILSRDQNSLIHETYSELSYAEIIVPKSKGAISSLDSNRLHLWPRDSSFICAIPNQDGSFVASLIMPHAGDSSFETLKSAVSLKSFLQKDYADFLKHAPELPTCTNQIKISRIITTQAPQWNFGGCAVLIGDASHAISPFFGQGMNAALEDASILVDTLTSAPSIEEGLAKFQNERKPDTDALCELSQEHLEELRQGLGSLWRIKRRQIETCLERILPDYWKSTYSLVAHSSLPYRKALRRNASPRTHGEALQWI